MENVNSSGGGGGKSSIPIIIIGVVLIVIIGAYFLKRDNRKEGDNCDPSDDEKVENADTYVIDSSSQSRDFKWRNPESWIPYVIGTKTCVPYSCIKPGYYLEGGQCETDSGSGSSSNSNSSSNSGSGSSSNSNSSPNSGSGTVPASNSPNEIDAEDYINMTDEEKMALWRSQESSYGGKGFDAGTFVSTGGDDKYYFFIDDNYWSKDEGSENFLTSVGDISTDWLGLNQTGIDAMVYNKDTEIYYFFKGGQYWSKKYGSKERVSGPQPLSRFGSGDPLPADLDAAVYNSKDEIYYFFKDGNYWSKERGEEIKAKGSVAEGWNNGIILPTKLDAAIYNSDNKRYYFFKGNQYWIKDYDKAIVDPQELSSTWGGCHMSFNDCILKW